VIVWLKHAENFVLDRLGRAVMLVALLVSGLFGGLEAVPDPASAVVAAGETFDAGPVWVTPLRASIYGETERLYLADKADHWIILNVKVEVTGTEPWRLPALLVGAPNVPGLVSDSATVYRADDRTMVTHIDPGLPVELAFVWEQAGSQDPPTSITVRFGQWTYREDALTPYLSLPGYNGWLPSDNTGKDLPGGVATVPVRDRRVAQPTPSTSPSVTP
jgi:hypothetical protein